MQKLNIISLLLIGVYSQISVAQDKWWDHLDFRDNKIYLEKQKKSVVKPVVQSTASYYKLQRVYFTSTTAWTVPAGVTQIKGLLVGGGGSGGAAGAFSFSTAYCTYGGGGGGGEIATFAADITGVSTINITVGAGGAGVNQGVSDCAGRGKNGGNSGVSYFQGGNPFSIYASGGGGGFGAYCSTSGMWGMPGAGGNINENLGGATLSNDFASQLKGAGGGAGYLMASADNCDISKTHGSQIFNLDVPTHNFSIGKGATFGGVAVSTVLGSYGISGNGGGGYGGEDAQYSVIKSSWDCTASASIKLCKPSLLAGNGGQGYWGRGGNGGYGGYYLQDNTSTASYATSGCGYGAGGAASGWGGGGGGGYMGDGNIVELGCPQNTSANSSLSGQPGIVILEYVTP